MFNIIIHQENANANHNELSPHICLNDYHQKITNTGEDMEKTETLYTVGGSVNWCSHCGEQHRDASTMKNKNTIQSSNSGYLKNTKTLI